MGVEYYIVDKKKKIFYDLGKGGWYILNSDLHYLKDAECLKLHITNKVFNYEPNQPHLKEFIEYIHNKVVPELIEHFGDSNTDDLTIFNDCGDDIAVCRAKKYRGVGSRYTDDNPEETLKWLNRHFEPDRQHMYDEKYFIDLPEWSKY